MFIPFLRRILIGQEKEMSLTLKLPPQDFYDPQNFMVPSHSSIERRTCFKPQAVILFQPIPLFWPIRIFSSVLEQQSNFNQICKNEFLIPLNALIALRNTAFPHHSQC